MKTYRTLEIARLCNIHPNTVRLYETLGYLPTVPRAKNGYRIYNEIHLEHVLLIRTAFHSTWLGGIIRRKALAVLNTAAAGRYREASALAREHLGLIVREREKAEMAASYLEKWANQNDNHSVTAEDFWKSGDVIRRLNITHDMLRSWERNGLITSRRDPQNGYRIFGEHDIQRLYVIRALRKARFSLMSIHIMLKNYDQGVRTGLAQILNELPLSEDDIFFNTNEWLTKIRAIEISATDLIHRLNRIKRLSEI